MFEEFMGTMPVSERQKFDTGALRDYMRQHVGPIQGDLAVEQFKGGQSNPTFKVSADGQQLRAAHQARPGRQAAAVGACDRARIPRHGCAQQGRLPGRQAVCAVHRRSGHRARLLPDGIRRRPRAVGPVAARHDPGRARRHLRRNEPRDRAIAHDRLRGDRAGRLRQARQLFRAPDRALDQAIPRVRNREDRVDGPADRLAARQHPARRRHLDRAWRLPARQHDLPPERAAHPGAAGLGAVDAGPSAGRFFLSLHELAHPARATSAASPASTWRRSAFRPRRTTSRAIASAPARPSARKTSAFTWPTTCSVWPASCKES